ncbi:hypothetical protein LUZ60_016784 [Juncus effusus]|nr:hypothetical protein LUZ60_016784 [Juncus effusus]
MNNITIVMVPFPAQGHLNQLLHLSLILSSQNLSIHYAASSIHINQAKSRLQGWPASALNSIHFHDLPIPPFSSPPQNPDSSVSFPSHLLPMFEVYEQVRPRLASLLQSLSKSSRRVVVIYDRLLTFAGIEASAISNGESYCFCCVPLSSILPWQGQDGPASGILKSRGLTLPSVDGCVTQEFEELATRHDESQLKDSGMLMNSSRLIEGAFVDLLMEQPDLVGKKLFFIGPVNPLNPTVEAETIEARHECLKWLDKQPTSSVLYISFGSCSALSKHQIEQLAIGLLNSNQRFIWVLREADRGNIFADRDETDLQSKLPLGFMKNIEGKGFIIKDWAPQLDILSHKSTVAFMSHCGWNSFIESISMGVPILAWPMHSDQPWNAILVSYLNVGLIVRDWERRTEIVKAEDIEVNIRKMMSCEEGEEIRRRAKELGEKVRDGGGSKAELLSFIDHITR